MWENWCSFTDYRSWERTLTVCLRARASGETLKPFIVELKHAKMPPLCSPQMVGWMKHWLLNGWRGPQQTNKRIGIDINDTFICTWMKKAVQNTNMIMAVVPGGAQTCPVARCELECPLLRGAYHKIRHMAGQWLAMEQTWGGNLHTELQKHFGLNGFWKLGLNQTRDNVLGIGTIQNLGWYLHHHPLTQPSDSTAIVTFLHSFFCKYPSCIRTLSLVPSRHLNPIGGI